MTSPVVSATAVLTLGCVAGAVALLWPMVASPAGDGVHRGGEEPHGYPRGGLAGCVVVSAVVVLGAFGLASPRRVLLLIVIGAATWAGGGLVRRRRAARAAERTSLRLLEACEQLTGELIAGQPPGAALDHGAAEWELVAPVAEAFRVGADVPDAWREAALRPGAHDLRLVAAAWQVSHRTGSGLASALEHVTGDLRAQHATRRVVAGELASARATARLVGVLPALVLTFGAGAGGDPWGFLLGHPIGLGCLALGLAFALAGLAWIEALAREVDRP